MASFLVQQNLLCPPIKGTQYCLADFQSPVDPSMVRSNGKRQNAAYHFCYAFLPMHLSLTYSPFVFPHNLPFTKFARYPHSLADVQSPDWLSEQSKFTDQRRGRDKRSNTPSEGRENLWWYQLLCDSHTQITTYKFTLHSRSILQFCLVPLVT